ncbi:serine/threonine-protein kinase oca2 isoform X2 [Daucus carota subsp. sativus]|uniref:serine/threonine-protein kinase oca2 isoform X2 n=1 Tax=Daucus carota subsp. sativus TaxID=79200 RepID=UPI003083DEC5
MENKTEELIKKIQVLESEHEQLKQEMSKLIISGDHHRRSQSISPQRRRRFAGDSGSLAAFRKGSASFRHSSPLRRESRSTVVAAGAEPENTAAAAAAEFSDSQYLSILESMGQSVHIFDLNFHIFYWNPTAQRLYGYSATEAHGQNVIDLLLDPEDCVSGHNILNHTLSMRETWTGKFPTKTKRGARLEVIATNSPFYDDNGNLIGVICVSNDSRPFEDMSSALLAAQKVDTDSSVVSRPRRIASAKLGLNPQQPLQVAIASKISDLASKVSSKVKSKMKTDDGIMDREGGSGGSHNSDHGFSDTSLFEQKEDAASSGGSTPRGEIHPSSFGVFSHTAHDVYLNGKESRDCGDEYEGKIGIHKIITSKAEAWMSKKNITWPWKVNGQERLEPRSANTVLPQLNAAQESNLAHKMTHNTSARPDNHEFENNRSPHKEAPGSWPSINVYSSGSLSSCGSTSSSTINRVDMEADSLDCEILWEDLTIGEQIGQGSCGTVYHGLWYGSDVAIKVFSKQEYSDDVIFAFREEVALMKRLRHPNILLFMGAVSSPERLCIVTEFLPRGSLFRLLQKGTSQKSASRLDWRRRVHMALDIARGMNYLHHCSPPIVHRDLKSSNLLVDKSWNVKVGDFGLSRLKYGQFLETITGKGTWMAPEVLRNEPSDEKSDVYSYGVVLWELATEKIPWDHLNSMQVIGAVGFMNQRLEIPNDVDARWASLIESCFQSEPKDRPTFQELLERLKDLQRQYAIQFKQNTSMQDIPP